MGRLILKIKLIIMSVMYFPLIWKYIHSAQRAIIDEDVALWMKRLNEKHQSNTKDVIKLLFFSRQFRNLFLFRLKSHSSFLRMLCKPDPTLFIADDCGEIAGGGIYFEHAYSSILEVNHIGKGCMIRQLTTFGVKSADRHDERPWIGDNVDFGANVTCIGNIHIGDNAVIAAGAVVVKDVPANAVVAGNPAKIIKMQAL